MKDQYHADINGGEWTDSLGDNYYARVDFKALAQSTSLEELIEKLPELAGTGVGYECYSCREVQGIAFQTKDIGVERIYNTERSDYFPKISLDGYIKQAEELPKDASAATIEATAQDITKGLVQEILDVTGSSFHNQHFVRTAKNADNPYEVVFYDLRDKDVLKNFSEVPEDDRKGDVLKNAVMDLKSYVKVKNEPIVEYKTHQETHDYVIQTAANSRQLVDLVLPDTSVAALGLSDYTVFREGFCSATPDKKWNPDFISGATSLGNHRYRAYIGGTTTYEEKEIDIEQDVVTKKMEMGTVKEGGWDDNGEYHAPVRGLVVVGTETTHISIHKTITVPHTSGGKWTTFLGYPPDDLLRVDNALAKLMRERVRLGALQNRLEHIWLCDENSSENLQTAESKIRDIDFAKAMVENAKLEILGQAGEAMMAQANENTRGLLGLLPQ